MSPRRTFDATVSSIGKASPFGEPAVRCVEEMKWFSSWPASRMAARSTGMTWKMKSRMCAWISVGAAKLVDGRVHLEKSGKRGCFRGLVGSGTIRRRIVGVGPVSLGIRERQQFLIDFVSEEVNKNRTPYSNMVAVHDDLCRKRESIDEGSVLAPTVPQQASIILAGKAAVLE